VAHPLAYSPLVASKHEVPSICLVGNLLATYLKCQLCVPRIPSWNPLDVPLRFLLSHVGPTCPVLSPSFPASTSSALDVQYQTISVHRCSSAPFSASAGPPPALALAAHPNARCNQPKSGIYCLGDLPPVGLEGRGGGSSPPLPGPRNRVFEFRSHHLGPQSSEHREHGVQRIEKRSKSLRTQARLQITTRFCLVFRRVGLRTGFLFLKRLKRLGNSIR
jgi:hypothetical protein